MRFLSMVSFRTDRLAVAHFVQRTMDLFRIMLFVTEEFLQRGDFNRTDGG
jgi:hypothetical protein